MNFLVSATHSMQSYCPGNQQTEAIMATGKKAASLAGKILRSPKSTKAERKVAASDLSQRKSTSTKRKKK